MAGRVVWGSPTRRAVCWKRSVRTCDRNYRDLCDNLATRRFYGGGVSTSVRSAKTNPLSLVAEGLGPGQDARKPLAHAWLPVVPYKMT